jgi:hypothetical protein
MEFGSERNIFFTCIILAKAKQWRYFIARDQKGTDGLVDMERFW